MLPILKRLLPPKQNKEDVIIKQVLRDSELAMLVYDNPFKILGSISLEGHLLLISGWLAWTCDGYDYFSGLLSDRFGRKWTLVGNLLLIAVFELGSSFCTNYGAFLGVRSMFGIAMGGIWGQAANTALENVPPQARGLVSGFLQQGYVVGYLIAAVVNLLLVPHTKHSWRALYWVGTGLSVFAAIFRACLPESRAFVEAKRESAMRENHNEAGKTKAFLRETKLMLKAQWKRAIWAVALMMLFNFLSHGSQDLYPTYLQKNKLFPSKLASKATIIANCGAVVGGIVFGYASQFSGRRLAIIVAIFWTGAFIPLWILPNSFGKLSAGAFFVQFGVQGAWGVVPIYLAETSPASFRASFGGIAYQLGNMISSASAQIEAKAGETLRVKVHGKSLPDYASVQGILIGIVLVLLLLVVLIGPDNHASHFEEAAVAFIPGAGLQDPAEFVDHSGHKGELSQQSSRMEAGHVGDNEKAEEMYVEKV
ncbi:hypothetical protein QFC21_004971 [Naganishia friedmannii]|uniref:Uncharacterized protein n=1 Tax=Naganishia friedmannii TaxID=89922 RepID=A0ACC2VEE7_9TREE|nr:hypothetical protein QFC21_004971 [Naganishia friedmannii]